MREQQHDLNDIKLIMSRQQHTIEHLIFPAFQPWVRLLLYEDLEGDLGGGGGAGSAIFCQNETDMMMISDV